MVELKDFLGIAGAPVVIALVAMIRVIFPEMSQRLLPVVALAFAAALNALVAVALQIDWPQAVIATILCSLTASGLYGQAKVASGN